MFVYKIQYLSVAHFGTICIKPAFATQFSDLPQSCKFDLGKVQGRLAALFNINNFKLSQIIRVATITIQSGLFKNNNEGVIIYHHLHFVRIFVLRHFRPIYNFYSITSTVLFIHSSRS